MTSVAYPPAIHPTMEMRPPSTPLTSATVSNPACHSPATAAQRLLAAPVLIGSRNSSSVRKPTRVRAMLQTSRPTASSEREYPALAVCDRSESLQYRSASGQARQSTASNAPPPQEFVCSDIHSASPPPSPAPPRFPAWLQPPARPL